MKIIREYEDPELVLEFEPNLGTRPIGKGNLIAAARDSEGEEETFSGRINLADNKDRLRYLADARDLFPEAFPEELTFAFNKHLNDLFLAADEEIESLEGESEEGEDEESPEDQCEEHAPKEDEHPERYAAAMEILNRSDVLTAAAATMRALGHVGEKNNKRIAFLCACSARAGLPVQPSTHAESAAGKNFLWDTVLALLPEELVLKRTGFSAKALFRTKMTLKGSVLYVQEVAGTEGADFSIRTLQSDGALVWEATEKAPDGTMVNVEHRVEGPCVIVQTTTKNHLHPENETRVVPIYLDDSAEQTERITEAALARAAGKGSLPEERRQELLTPWQDAIRLLKPAAVVIPFAERIRVPSTPIRLRRDVPRLLNIIRLIAWFHQYTRETDDEGRILATKDDFEFAKAMVGLSFERAWKNLTPSEEKVYRACKALDESRRKGFKRAHVEAKLKDQKEDVPPRTVKECLKSLAGTGYLDSDHKRGVEGATYSFATKSASVGSIDLAPEEVDVEDPELVDDHVAGHEAETADAWEVAEAAPDSEFSDPGVSDPENAESNDLPKDDEKNSDSPLAHLPINEKSSESGLDRANLMGKSESALSCPFLPIKEDDARAAGAAGAAGADVDEDEWAANGQMGKKGQKATCPLKTHSHAGKVPNEQWAKDSAEKNFDVVTDAADVEAVADDLLAGETEQENE